MKKTRKRVRFLPLKLCVIPHLANLENGDLLEHLAVFLFAVVGVGVPRGASGGEDGGPVAAGDQIARVGDESKGRQGVRRRAAGLFAARPLRGFIPRPRAPYGRVDRLDPDDHEGPPEEVCTRRQALDDPREGLRRSLDPPLLRARPRRRERNKKSPGPQGTQGKGHENHQPVRTPPQVDASYSVDVAADLGYLQVARGQAAPPVRVREVDYVPGAHRRSLRDFGAADDGLRVVVPAHHLRPQDGHPRGQASEDEQRGHGHQARPNEVDRDRLGRRHTVLLRLHGHRPLPHRPRNPLLHPPPHHQPLPQNLVRMVRRRHVPAHHPITKLKAHDDSNYWTR
mmetsp:Transcript_29915/g.96533  ORF Transcript_29915/g.96533 Transcript_29915/m.96533 type:complete len:340 (+) Transcript_29915:1192-2211(+)